MSETIASNGAPPPPPPTPTEGAPRWFIYHNAARSDIFRGAQNQADATGQPQEVWLGVWLLPEDEHSKYAKTVVTYQHDPTEDPVTRLFALIAVVKCNPRRAEAGR